MVELASNFRNFHSYHVTHKLHKEAPIQISVYRQQLSAIIQVAHHILVCLESDLEYVTLLGLSQEEKH